MKNIIEFMDKIQDLKETKRTGWVLKDIPNPETVADHSYGVFMLTMSLANELDVDSDKLMKMSLIEDIGESIIGDITPHDDVSEEEKIDREEKAVEELSNILEDEEVLELWREFEKGNSKEAKIAKQADNLEMTMQALRYEKEHGKSEKMNEFYDYTEERLSHPRLKEIFQEIKERREKLK